MVSQKIGLVCATLNNHGTLLQAFALQEIIRKYGVNPEIIKYNESIVAKLKRMQNKDYLKACINNILLCKLTGFFYPTLQNYINERNAAFDKFRCEKLIYSKTCNSQKQLTDLSTQYSMVLVGSDQVWHPANLMMHFFTLSFVPDNVTKGAYAPSFGMSVIPKKLWSAYRSYLERFRFLSCREEAGIKIIKKLTGKDVPVVCDPTLLMTATEWQPILSSNIRIQKKFIFCYFLGNNPDQRQFVKELKKKTGYIIVALKHVAKYVKCDEGYADITPFQVGPSEFLYLLKNAEFVCTDSFHAVVFSLQFHKQFLAFDRFENGKGHSTTSRIETLLGVVDKKDRLIRNTKEALVSMPALHDIDYTNIDKKLENFRKFSYDYLKKILDSVIENGKENC